MVLDVGIDVDSTYPEVWQVLGYTICERTQSRIMWTWQLSKPIPNMMFIIDVIDLFHQLLVVGWFWLSNPIPANRTSPYLYPTKCIDSLQHYGFQGLTLGEGSSPCRIGHRRVMSRQLVLLAGTESINRCWWSDDNLYVLITKADFMDQRIDLANAVGTSLVYECLRPMGNDAAIMQLTQQLR